MKQIQILKIAVVLLMLVIPAMAFIVPGPVSGFEQKQQMDFPGRVSVFLPASEGREQLADAIFERSVAKRWSIQFMNALHLFGFGFIDTDRAITGRDQWLFYKPQFVAWDCDRHDVLQEKLERFQFLMELVSAAEIPLVFAQAPNKASIERGYLGGRTARYLDCYFNFERQFAAAVSAMPVQYFVDHTQVLVHSDDKKPSYLKFDSHWTLASGLEAMNQLFESRPGILGLPLYEPEYRDQLEITNTLSKILLLNHKRLIAVPVSVKPSANELQSVRLANNVLFINDSFYGRIHRYLVDRSPNAHFFPSGSAIDESVTESLEKADIVVVEMVQRHFLESLWSKHRFGWGGFFAQWLLEELAVATQNCGWEKAREIQNAGKDSMVFQLPDEILAGRICLRVKTSFEAAGEVRLYFSVTDPAVKKTVFTDARMVSKNMTAGVNSLALILPESFTKQWVKLELADQTGNASIQILELAPLN